MVRDPPRDLRRFGSRPRRDQRRTGPRPRRDRDVGHFGRDETETRCWYVSRPSRDRDVETETTSLPGKCGFSLSSDPYPKHSQYRPGCFTFTLIQSHQVLFGHSLCRLVDLSLFCELCVFLFSLSARRSIYHTFLIPFIYVLTLCFSFIDQVSQHNLIPS